MGREAPRQTDTPLIIPAEPLLHEAAIDLRPMSIVAKIVLTVDGEWRRSRLFRSHEQAELAGAIADTRAMFEAKGWLDGRLSARGINRLTGVNR